MSTHEEIYLDYAASAPLDPAVLEVMERALRDAVANPSSTHAAGRRSARIVELARERVAARIGAAAPERVVFTSGATEANNRTQYLLRSSSKARARA
jgi:cysteine desulfurase